MRDYAMLPPNWVEMLKIYDMHHIFERPYR